MYVYFIFSRQQAGRSAAFHYKIGIAADVAKRLNQLQIGCPTRLHVFGVLPCKDRDHAFRIERELHEYFAPRRTVGEWFRFAAEQTWQVGFLMDHWQQQDSLAVLLGITKTKAKLFCKTLHVNQASLNTGPHQLLQRKPLMDIISAHVDESLTQKH